MLLKAFLCPLGSPNIFKSLIPLYRVFPAYKLSTISSTDIPIQKILKATSNRKFDTAQDAMFCSVIIQMISNNKTLNKKDLSSIEKEVQRMISKSLSYMNELPVSEALLLSNRLLNLLSSKNVKINSELKTSFLKKINNNIQISLNRNCENVYFNKVLDYVKFLVNSKAPRPIITDLLTYMGEKASTDQQILDIVNVYLSLKSRNILFWFHTIQIFIEKRIGSRIHELPITSPLIDERILQLFLNFKLHLKWPFNCFPVWVFILMDKLKQKHLNSKFQIASSKRINFLSTYVMVVKSAQNFSQCYFLKSQNLTFIVEYFLKICELFDGSQMETMEQKIQPFFELFFALYLFFKHHSLFHNEALLFGMDQTMCNIFNHYYSQIPSMISKSGKDKQKLIMSLIRYCLRYYNMLQIYQNRNIRCATYLPKIFNKVKQVFIREFSHQKQEGQSYSHYKLLPILTRFSKEFEKVNISTGKYEMHKILQKCQTYLQNLSSLDMQKIYSGKNIIDVISFVRVSMLCVQFPISHKFATIYQQHQANNFSLVVETYYQFNFKCNEVLEQQILRLNRILVGKFEKYLSQQHGSQKFIADLSSGHYKYQNMEEQLSSNLIQMFKMRPMIMKSIDSKLYNFWFIQHPDIIIKTFSASPPKNTSYWVSLISNIKYLRKVTRQCAIDLMAQIMRVCQNKRIQDFFISIFTDKVIYSSLFEKVDQIAQFKYIWIVMLFNKIYLNSCLKYMQPNNQDFMIYKHEFSNDKVLFHNSVQLMAIFSKDIKSPLEVGSFKSQLICRAVNQIINNTYQIFESNCNKRAKDLSILRRERQKNLSMLPIEQLIYLLTEHNFEQQASWLSYVNEVMFSRYIQYKYTTLQQYNLLLSLNKMNPQAKRAINYFISLQMQQFGYNSQSVDNNHLYESTVLKFYSYLLQPNPTQDYLRQSFEIIDNQNAIKNSQIIDYWICKAIVLNTVDDRLISCMLKRLFLISTELTYLQFSTITNTLITLFKKGRLLNYKQKNSTQWKQLRLWIKRNMLELVEPNPKRFLLDYFTLIFHQLVDPIASIEDQMEQLVGFQMSQDNIEIVHHLYTNKHYLSEKNFQDLRHMLERCRDRALFLSYQNLPQNCYFRVGFFLVRLWAIAIRNDANHNSNQWFINHISTAFDTTGIIDFLSAQENQKFVHLIIKRYRISEAKLGSLAESKLFQIIRKFAQIEQSQLQSQMTQKQKILSKDQIDSNWEEVKVSEKGLQMYKNGGNIMYFLEGSQVSAEQQIQMDYLKLLLGPQISVSIRKRHQTIQN